MRLTSSALRSLVIVAVLLVGWPGSAAAQERTPAPREGAAEPASFADRLVRAAERHLGKPYVFGGRDGRPGCRGRKRCPAGIDCQSLVFFAFEAVTGRHWTRYSVMPSVSVRRGELGGPVAGLAGVLASEVDPTLLQRGDVVLFLLEGYNLEADTPLLVRGDRRYGVWHLGLVHEREGDSVRILHAKPGDRVVVEPLDAVGFDALYVLRVPGSEAAESREQRPTRPSGEQ